MRQHTIYCIIDLDTNEPIRWHADYKALLQWIEGMNAGEGRARYTVRIKVK